VRQSFVRLVHITTILSAYFRQSTQAKPQLETGKIPLISARCASIASLSLSLSLSLSMSSAVRLTASFVFHAENRSDREQKVEIIDGTNCHNSISR
jgi:hypothetical protein